MKFFIRSLCTAFCVFVVSLPVHAWGPNVYVGVSLAGPSLGFSAGTKISEKISARFIFGGDVGELITDGNFQGQLLYFPNNEKARYLFVGSGRDNGQTNFVRGGLGKNWNVSSWRFNMNLGLSVKVSNRNDRSVADIAYYQPLGFGVHYVFK